MSDKREVERLRACPFCGNAAAPMFWDSDDAHSECLREDDGNAVAFAVVCDASTPNGRGGCGASGGFFEHKKDAAEAWNRRAAPPSTEESSEGAHPTAKESWWAGARAGLGLHPLTPRTVVAERLAALRRPTCPHEKACHEDGCAGLCHASPPPAPAESAPLVDPNDAHAYERWMKAEGEREPRPSEATLDVMERTGGSFVRALAECYRRADQTNRAILRDSFGHYFSDYAKRPVSAQSAPQEGVKR